MPELRISSDLCLPTDAVTQTVGFIGRKGSGKTYAAGKLAEELLDAGAQVVVLDPVGNWFGLRLAADGVSPGYSIPILGGEHGDIPLEPSAGALVADLVVDQRVSVVLDVSPFRKTQRQQFVTAFAEQLFHRKKSQRSPVHLILEEAQVFAPQRPSPATAPMLGAIEDIVRLGRNYGIGASLISQRPQSVNKEVLNQTECLFVLQVNGAHERKAIEDWVVDKGISVKEMVDALPSLPVGDAFVWSPQWLRVTKRVHIDAKRTFDASSTPTLDSSAPEPGHLGTVDLDVLRERMAETIERAKADDPKALRAEIARLTRELSERPESDDSELRTEVERAHNYANAGLREAVLARELLRDFINRLWPLIGEFESKLDAARDLEADGSLSVQAPVAQSVERLPSKQEATGSRPVRSSNADGPLGKAERAVLTVLAQYPQGRSMGQLALLAGYRQSGGFRNTLSALRTAGHIEGGNQQVMRITEGGLAALGPYEPMPRGRALLDQWVSDPRLGKGHRAVLEYAYDRYPDDVSGEEAAGATGYEYSGGFRNILSWLRTAELIEGGNASFHASPLFFEGGR